MIDDTLTDGDPAPELQTKALPNKPSAPGKSFESESFRVAFVDLVAWRRDVRRFKRDDLGEELMLQLVGVARLAPSVGLSQPWRFVRVVDPKVRASVRSNFETCNAEALAGYAGDRAALYSQLKLAGLMDAPEQLAVFCEMAPMSGSGLGRRTMPETLEYSVVAAIQTMWLFARSLGVGIGWVSILDAERLCKEFGVPPSWKLVAYLCIGLPLEESLAPELQELGWEERLATPPEMLTI